MSATNPTGRRKSRVQIEQQEGLFSAPSSIARQSKTGLLDPKQGGSNPRQSLGGRRQSAVGPSQGQERRPLVLQPQGQSQGQPQSGTNSKNPIRDSTNLGLDAFCNSSITIPPALPDILKQYAKNAMRTDPPDLLAWSGLYFR